MKIDNALGSVRLDPAELSSDGTPLRDARRLRVRRLCFWGPAVGAAVAGTWLGATATVGSGSVLRGPLLVLLAANLLYMAVTGLPALIGVVLHLAGRRLRAGAKPSGLSRTAVLMPVHKEDPRAVFAAMEVMARGIADAGLANVELFVLSDTQDVVMAADELAVFEALQARMPPSPPLQYRRRPSNAGRKVGNLAEFCERRGAAYDYMVVLDADSVMGASAISALVGLMDANPRTGIIQTVPYAVGRSTLFARLQQFAARLYTPLLVEGLTFWQQSDGNYWGHNAIIRVAPFMAHCGLPTLPGREPWGGEILCHDVVEAGLMRGAGWDVWVLPEVLESYEAVPANLVDYAARERRWCQGNLQHGRVMGHGGLRAVGRFHLGYGIAHYLAAPMAAAFLLLATVDALAGGGFARLLLSHGVASAALIGLGSVLLYGGKVATLLVTVADRAAARTFGGRWALLASAALEQVVAVVVSSLMIVLYCRYVLDLVLGRTVRWDPLPRDDRGLSGSEAWLRTRLPTLVGAGWVVCLPLLPHAVWPWAMPLALGLLATWPVTWVSSRTDVGLLARRWRLLLTPEEASPSPILRAYQRALRVPEQGAVETRGAGVAAAVGVGMPVMMLVPQGGKGR